MLCLQFLDDGLHRLGRALQDGAHAVVQDLQGGAAHAERAVRARLQGHGLYVLAGFAWGELEAYYSYFPRYCYYCCCCCSPLAHFETVLRLTHLVSQWLKTDLGGSYADFPVDVGVTELKRIILEANKSQSGKFMNIYVKGHEKSSQQYDGGEIPW